MLIHARDQRWEREALAAEVQEFAEQLQKYSRKQTLQQVDKRAEGVAECGSGLEGAAERPEEGLEGCLEAAAEDLADGLEGPEGSEGPLGSEGGPEGGPSLSMPLRC